MSDHEVRIIELQPLTVAAAQAFGASPEGLAWDKILAYAKVNNLPIEPVDGAGFFGFNNPDPSPGSPNYGYEQWLVVDENAGPGDGVEIKQFGGGLYAVMRCESLAVIGETWQALVAWSEDSPYHKGHHQWLEKLLTSPTGGPDNLTFDLYLPIVK